MRLFRNKFLRSFPLATRPSAALSVRKTKCRDDTVARRASIALELLEGRMLLSSVIVNSISDAATGAGVVTLRDAIASANSSTTPTAITFDPTVFATPETIVLNGKQLVLSNTSEPTLITGPASGVTVSGNNASRVFVVDNGVTASLQAINIINGNAPGPGGGVENSGSLTFENASVDGNKCANGGGGIFNSGNATLENVSLFSNTATDGHGGGFENYGGVVGGDVAATLTDVTVSGNSSNLDADGHGDGGGIASDNYGSTGTTTIALRNVTVTDNTSGTTGGGIFLDASNSNSSLIGVTVAGNSAVGDGGGMIDLAGAGATLGNTIIAGNSITGVGSTGPDVSGAFVSSGHNLIGKTDGSTGWTGSDLAGTVAEPLNADLGPLADNGGPTETMLPQAGSPAIGAGSVALIPAGITTDQRGFPRTVNGTVDIGAVEEEARLASQLAFVPQPSDTTTGMLGLITVDVEDSSGALVATDDSEVTLALAGGTSGAILGGTATVAAVNGVATFNNLSITTPGNNYTLTATDGALSSATSTPFNITAVIVPPMAVQLAFMGSPTSTTTTGTVGPITVDVEDSSGALVTTDDSDVTLVLAGGTSGATLGGTATMAAVNGIATFDDLSITTVGDNYTLTATDGALSAATSTPFNITAAISPPSLVPALGTVKLPSSVVAGAKLNAKVPVIVTDQGSAYKGSVTTNIYADTGTSLDGNQVWITSLTKTVSLKAGKSQTFNFTIKSLPSTLPDGTYYLLAEVVDSTGATNVTATTQTVAVAAPFVQPSVSVGAVTPANIAINKSGSVQIVVTNYGNVAGSGINVTLGLSTDGVTPVTGVTLASTTGSAKIQPDKSKTFKLHFKVTSALAAGSYFPYVSVTLGGVSTTEVGTVSFTIA